MAGGTADHAGGGQPHYSGLAITTALTLRAVFGLALRQTEGLIGSIIELLGLDLAAFDPEPPGQDGARAAAATARNRAPAPARGQHRGEARRHRRMADREARHLPATILAQAASRRRWRQRRDYRP